ncbi:MAG: porphobilinogen synthase [Candidatus Electryoneaceae bacterium]|nr:porphobilinogen synthase [Candidatus Electryoneaceae bacterium]
MAFPIDRPRRLRRTPTLRRLVCETTISTADLVQPLFIVEGASVKRPITSLSGQYHYSPDMAAEEAVRLHGLDVPAVILFGIPDHKDNVGSGAWDGEGVVQQAVRLIKQAVPEILVITDLCLCEYTDHGHCGVLVDNDVDNDATLELLARTAVSQAEAGADIIAPSDMMDGRIGAVRTALDRNGFSHLSILSYAVKYASAYYGPFRDAAGSAPSFGDRRGYQMDPPNRLEAIREAALDIEEGADMIMVKPAMPYLDVLYEVKRRFGRVTAAYQVSGEYAMIEAAADRNLIDRKRVIMESLISIKRAGADFILTYFAAEAAQWLIEGTFQW